MKSLAEDGFDVGDGCSTAIRTLIVGLFGGPSRDTGLAEQFTAAVALVGLKDNLYADGTLE